MRCWIVDRPGTRRDGNAARARDARAAGARPARDPRPRLDLRGVPHRSASRRRRSRAPAARRDPRSRSRRRRRRDVATRPTRFAIGDRVGIAWLRWTCGVCRFCRRGDENLCVAPLFTGWDADGGYAELAVVDERYAYAIPDAVRRRARGTAAVRRDHRIPRVATRVASARRASRHLRLRRIGPPRRAGRDARGRGRARVHPFAGSPPARTRARRGVGRRHDRRTTRAAPGRDPLRAGRRASSRSRSEALDSGGTLAIAGISLTDIPTPVLRAAPLPRTQRRQCHRQHPARRRRVPRDRGPHPHPRDHDARIRSTAPTTRCATSRPTGSTGAAVLHVS